MSTSEPAVEGFESSLPLERSEKTWGGLAVFGNTSSAAVATWCFISGGFVAAYLGATQGAIAIVAGTLIGVFVVLLAALPAASRYGVEAVRSTRTIFGVRGSFATVVLTMIILVGWNAVLTISLSDAVVAALVQLGAIGSGSIGLWSPVFSLVGLVVVFLLLRRGNSTLRWAGPVVAITVLVLAVWIAVMILSQFGLDRIVAASALDPFPDNRINYMLVIELGIAGGMSWWPYVGGLTRNAKSMKHAALPSVAGLGLMMGLVLSIGMIAALVVPASGGDPTSFLIELGGPLAGVFALAFLVFANIGTVMVGAYTATLGLKQISAVDRRISWPWAVVIVLIPVALVATAFSDLFMANYGAFITLAGILLGPICGMQVADYFIIRRQNLDVRSLFTDTSGSRYWYLGGFNPVGFVSLAAGIATYLLLLNPFTYEPGLSIGIVSASVPCAIVAGVVYLILMRIVPALWCTRELPEPTNAVPRRTQASRSGSSSR